MRLIHVFFFTSITLSMSIQTSHAQSIVAHRGASADAPENTLAAFQLAWRQDSDAIEGDFYLTADGHIVCHHDRSAKRTANLDRNISDMTLKELKQLEFGSWKHDQFKGEPIPTLSEVLDSVPNGKRILIEIKCGVEIVKPLAALLDRCELDDDQLRIICFDADVIHACKQALPRVKAYWLTGFDEDEESGKWTPTIDQVLQQLEQCQADGLDCNANPKVVDAGFVKRLRDRGYEFHCWTINDPRMAQHFSRLGVDSITTDKPLIIRQAIENLAE